MTDKFLLLDMLADGRFHSGETLGQQLGISRTAVWKVLQTYTELGLEVQAVPGRGYRLARPVELLDESVILDAIDEPARVLLSALEVHRDIESTNGYLLDKVNTGVSSGFVCLAERQQAGRGRRGRHWISPFGANLYLSVLWKFDTAPSALSGLSLAIGIAVIRALRDNGITSAGLKWPNDIVINGQKLAGILIEMTGESAGPCHVVTGVGININMPESAGRQIDQAWVDMNSLLEDENISRNRFAGKVVEYVVSTLDSFSERGLSSYMDEWNRVDVLVGRPVVLHMGNGDISGVACGIDMNGALIVDCNGKKERFDSGEVSLRAAS